MTSALRLPSIDGLRAFEAAARLGSFERAAEELCVTASAVGKRVATLEQLIGLTLLERGPKPLLLTPAGRDYMQTAGAALALLVAMPQHRSTRSPTQRLRVTTPPTFARQVLVPALASFAAAEPQIELEVLLSIPFSDGADNDADVEVRHGPPSLGATLLHDRVLPLAAPALLQRLPPLRKPADLVHAPLLRTPLEPWAPWFQAAGLPWPEPAAGARLFDLGMTLEAAVSGQGIVLGRPALALNWLGAGGLRPVFETAPGAPAITAEPAHQYRVLPHEGAAAQAFVRWLRGICTDLERQAQALLSGHA